MHQPLNIQKKFFSFRCFPMLHCTLHCLREVHSSRMHWLIQSSNQNSVLDQGLRLYDVYLLLWSLQPLSGSDAKKYYIHSTLPIVLLQHPDQTEPPNPITLLSIGNIYIKGNRIITSTRTTGSWILFLSPFSRMRRAFFDHAPFRLLLQLAFCSRQPGTV